MTMYSVSIQDITSAQFYVIFLSEEKADCYIIILE